ncbi:MAG TPA: hypothetical protein VFF47_08170 [Nitrospirota bacterium]|nr:hypothetical protein [Nitrospirota bacterium]
MSVIWSPTTPLNNGITPNEGDDPHSMLTLGTDQWFDFVYLPDQSCPC